MTSTATTTTEARTAPTTDRRNRLTLIAALNCTQNLSLGSYTYAFLKIAQANGVPLAAIGAAAGVAMILTVKFLWAPLVDRFGSKRLGHYRGWLLVTQTTLGIGIGALAPFDPAQDFNTLYIVFAVLFLDAATQDIAADAAATRLLRPSERGIGNGFQSAGSAVAQVGGGLVLVVYHFAGWQTAALMLAVLSGGALVAAGAFGFVPVVLAAGVLSLVGLLFTVWQLDRVIPKMGTEPAATS